MVISGYWEADSNIFNHPAQLIAVKSLVYSLSTFRRRPCCVAVDGPTGYAGWVIAGKSWWSGG